MGTNNIKFESCDVVLGRYRKLMDVLKSKRNRKVTLIGIPTRYDVSSLVDSRKVAVNRRLRELCVKEGVEFVDFECGRGRLARDGLHLNGFGQEELARKIFSHCKRFLV